MGILSAMNVGCDGLKVHGMRLDISSKNIANLDTPNYVRKIPLVVSTDRSSFLSVMNQMKESTFGTGTLPYASGSVAMAGVVEDPTLGDRLYKPGHPDADENGYIRTSNVDPLVEITDAIMAQRAYEASLAIITMSKSMADKAATIGS
ncbi:TPA: flagellar basal body rod protein FlgC [Candidatus Avigastranaerophilus faecigallinarum]|nr:flagellar basal body rod protein FlgC [Candidatus Avigastranaerophilus faecigallinarum]